MLMAARLTLAVAFLIRKKAGTPISAAAPKHRSWRFVRLKMILDLTRERSRGTEIYIATFSLTSLRQCAESTLRARLPVLNREKHSSTVYPITPQMEAMMSSLKDTVCTSTA